MISQFDLCGLRCITNSSFFIYLLQFVRMRRLRIKAARSSVKYERVERSYQTGKLCGLVCSIVSLL